MAQPFRHAAMLLIYSRETYMAGMSAAMKPGQRHIPRGRAVASHCHRDRGPHEWWQASGPRWPFAETKEQLAYILDWIRADAAGGFDDGACAPDHSVTFLHGFAALTQTCPEDDLRWDNGGSRHQFGPEGPEVSTSAACRSPAVRDQAKGRRAAGDPNLK